LVANPSKRPLIRVAFAQLLCGRLVLESPPKRVGVVPFYAGCLRSCWLAHSPAHRTTRSTGQSPAQTVASPARGNDDLHGRPAVAITPVASSRAYAQTDISVAWRVDSSGPPSSGSGIVQFIP